MKSNEGYPKDWLRVVLMVSPTGELHAIGGDHPVGYGEDAPYAGLERIKRFWKHFGRDGNEVTPVALGEAFQKSLPSPATSRDCETLARLKENLLNDEANQALRAIAMLCGNSDPSDGEGTSPQDVLEMVIARLNALSERPPAHPAPPLPVTDNPQEDAFYERAEKMPDKYGNTEQDPLRFCCFPDCGCDGAIHCMAKSGPSQGARVLNREHRSNPLTP